MNTSTTKTALRTIRLTTRPSRGESYQTWLNKWVDALEAGHKIKAGSISAGPVVDGLTDLGRMGCAAGGDIWTDFLRDPIVNNGIDYVIYSYGTPIAMWSASQEVWFVPAVKYSRTTTNHQNKIHTFLRELGYPVVDTVEAARGAM